LAQRPGERGWLSGWHQEPRYTIQHYFGQPADRRRYHRQACRHRLDRGDAETFLMRRHDSDIPSGHYAPNVLPPTEEAYLFGNPEFVGAPFQLLAQRSGARDLEPDLWELRMEQHKGLQEIL